MLSIILVTMVSGLPIWYFARNNSSKTTLCLVGLVSLMAAWVLSFGLSFASDAGKSAFERHFGMYFWVSVAGAVSGAFYGKKYRIDGARVPTAVVAFLLIVVAAIGSWLFLSMRVNKSDQIPHEAASEHHSTASVATDSIQEQQQHLLLVAAKEIISKYPQLDTESAAKDQAAIDYVVSRRDAYIANGQQVDIALRMAANDYGEQLRASQQSEAEKSYAKQVSSYRFTQPSVSQPSTASNDYIRRKNEGCQPKDVMTDEEIARCRGR